MKKVIIATALLFSVGTSFAASAPNSAVASKPINSWECADFLTLQETYRPVAVKSIEIINEKATPNDVATDDIYFDTAIVETVTPEVVVVCKADPKAPFVKTVNQVNTKHKAQKK